MAKDIIIKPIISEKAERISGKVKSICFSGRQRRQQAGDTKAFSVMFPDVTVNAVNTMVNQEK